MLANGMSRVLINLQDEPSRHARKNLMAVRRTLETTLPNPEQRRVSGLGDVALGIEQDGFLAAGATSGLARQHVGEQVGRLDVASLPALVGPTDHSRARARSRAAGASSNGRTTISFGGGHRRIREGVRPGRDSARHLHVDGSFPYPALSRGAVHPLNQPLKVVRGEIKLVQASFQASEVFGLEPAPSLIHAEDFIHGIPEEETAVPDRDHARSIGMISPFRQAKTSIRVGSSNVF